MPGLIDSLIVFLLALGGLFSLLAAVGIVVMPDVYTRMQAASKAVTFGATSIVLAAALHFHDPSVVARCLLVCVFLFVTIPVASHLIARAAYRAGEPLSADTSVNELAEEGEDVP